MNTAAVSICKKGNCELLPDETQSIRCISGVLWVTCYNCIEDYVVYEGEQLSLVNKFSVIVEGIKQSEYIIE